MPMLAFVDFRHRTHSAKNENQDVFTNGPSEEAPRPIMPTVASETDSAADASDASDASETSGTISNVSDDDAKLNSLTLLIRSIKRTASQISAWFITLAKAILTSKQMQSLLKALATIHTLWQKRPKGPYTLYAVVMALMTAAATLFIQWGMYTEPTYDDPNAVDDTTKILNSVNGQLTKFVSQMWLEGKLNWLLNFCALGMIYLVLVFILNRFWIATAVFAIAMSSFAVANSIKVDLRNEPVIPSDLSFLSSGNGGEITSFIPKGSQGLVDGTITMLVWLTIICLILQCIDGRRCVIPFHWWRPFRNAKTIIGNCTRIIAAALSVALLWSFTWNLGTNGSWSYNWAKSLGDRPVPWSTAADATNNGPAVSFLRLAHAKIMETPENYSEETMLDLAQRYAKNAQATNQSRANELTDSTVIMILSESFSDPTRVPGVALLEDPMPNIRTIKDSTTSGLMLSSAIGGGTANIEHQALTGLSLALFDDSMQSPYQELVPHQQNPYTFNQIWNAKYGQSGSVAVHPFSKDMYLRDANYKKFGFNHLYTLDSTPAITHQEHIDSSPYVSDAASYQNVLDALNNSTHAQFIQLVTMQNHTPYDDFYTNNQFREADISELSDDEKWGIDSYAKGVNLTDQATADFLNQLNTIEKPITVIFYGDHLPAVYSTAAADNNNTIPLHETDYSIWSNQTSVSAGTKLDANNTGFVSSNYFMALAAEHMNAKVSPYLEMLTEVHATLPAFNRLVGSNSSWSDDSSTAYLDASGNRIKRKELSEEARALLRDYRLVQYDMTKGKGYLQDSFFAAG
ncbi:LTA synthase family protein [Bifidobacterium saguini]|nr:alkaline phosphatase family protein [Bifidobacterium saguini]